MASSSTVNFNTSYYQVFPAFVGTDGTSSNTPFLLPPTFVSSGPVAVGQSIIINLPSQLIATGTPTPYSNTDFQFAAVTSGAATQLRITLVSEVRAAPYTVLGWTVVDLEGEMDRLVAAGVRFNRYEGMAQDDRGVWTTPDGARIAWFHDPDGNNLSLQS